MVANEDMKLFFSETEDLLQKIEDSTLKLEENPRNDQEIQNLYFAFHTIKGLVAMVGLENLSQFCHEVENLLDKNKEFKKRESRINNFISLLFESLDLMRNILSRLKAGKKIDIDKQTLERVMNSFEEGTTEDAISFIKPITKEELAKAKSSKFYKIYIKIQDTCVFKKVRLFIIFRALSNIGRLCSSKPDPGLLAKGHFDWDFEVYFMSNKSSTEILNILNEILEIDKKTVKSMNFNSFSTEISKYKITKRPEIKEETYIEQYEDTSSNIQESEEYVSAIIDDFSNTTSQITSVKVNIDVLESLMNNFGEIIILKNQLSQFLKETHDWEINRLFDTMDKHFLEIQETIFKLKLVKVESTFRRYKRLVRDLAKETDKQVKFVVEGINVEIDRKILEELNSPLVHLLRNAIYHGLEPSRQRSQNNKDVTGLLRLKSYRQAGSIYIEVSDDGRGIDYDRVRQKLIEKGMLTLEEVRELSDEALNQKILTAGFSTLEGADLVSGRGMGLAIVSEKIKELGGTLEIYSERNIGTTFRLTVPFTRAILKAQLLKIGGDLFAIPIEYIKQIYFFNRELVEYVKGEEYYRIDQKLIPIVRLDEYLNYIIKDKDGSGNSKTSIAIWCQRDDKSSALFIVNEILQQMELVIKPFRSRFSEFQEILGVSITGDGSICLIIDILNMISSLTRGTSDGSLENMVNI